MDKVQSCTSYSSLAQSITALTQRSRQEGRAMEPAEKPRARVLAHQEHMLEKYMPRDFIILFHFARDSSIVFKPL